MTARQFLREHRTSARFAFALHLGSRAMTAALNLWWSRALVEAMGPQLNGMLITFQRITSLGGLGDLGLGTVVGLRVGRHLGGGSTSELSQFLASARAMFAMLALVILFFGFTAAPWLPRWLGFAEQPNTGSMTLLFCLGSISAALVILGSYVQNVNYGAGNITWPIAPAFILTHLAIAANWFLAIAGMPLTVQYSAYVIGSATQIWLVWWLLKVSHPELAAVRPLHFSFRGWLPMVSQTFWSYLWSIGSVIYTATDTILINKGFGPEMVNGYYFNLRLIDLSFFVVVTAASVSLPKITQWMAANTSEGTNRALDATYRLLVVQTFLGCCASITYLAINDWFINWWYGETFAVPLSWQAAFALSLAVTAGGSAAMQVSTRCGQNGLRYSGIVVGITALTNLSLSVLALNLGSILGIALATVVAQTFFSLVIGRYVCRYFGIAILPWAFRSWALPVAVVLPMYFARVFLPKAGFGMPVMLIVAAALILLSAVAVGMNRDFLRREWAALQSMWTPR